MNSESTIAMRLRQLMETAHMSENELSRRSGVPQPTIHRILMGTSKSPRIGNLEKLAKSLSTTTSYLAHGVSISSYSSHGAVAASVGFMPSALGFMSSTFEAINSTRQKLKHSTYHYPILDWPDLGWHSIKSSSFFKNTINNPNTNYEPSSYKTIGTGFWLSLNGDAMSSPAGVTPSLPAGTKILFDTGVTSTPGKLVLALLLDVTEPVFRKFIKDGGQSHLQALNPSYPLIPLKEDSLIFAVAIEAKTSL